MLRKAPRSAEATSKEAGWRTVWDSDRLWCHSFRLDAVEPACSAANETWPVALSATSRPVDVADGDALAYLLKDWVHLI